MNNKGRTIAIVVLLFFVGTFGGKLAHILDIVQGKVNQVSKTVTDGQSTIITLQDRVNNLRTTVGDIDPSVASKLNDILAKLGNTPTVQTLDDIKNQLNSIERTKAAPGPQGPQGIQGPAGQSPSSSSTTNTTMTTTTKTTTKPSTSSTSTTRPPSTTTTTRRCRVNVLGICA